MKGPLITRRKGEHLEICATEAVEAPGATTWLEDVRLVHQALPELDLDGVDLGSSLGGKRLQSPVLIACMSGGSEAGRRMNGDLAEVAEELGIGLGLGSQRVALDHPEHRASFQLRERAPTALLVGNIGLQQARDLPDPAILELLDATGIDLLAVHLNPAMELFQREGDRDFRGGRAAIERLAGLLGERLVVKETGCGIGREAGLALKQAGVRIVDAAGAGGTSWVRVESLRGANPELLDPAAAGSPFDDWGIPTAACLVELAPLGFHLIASGGIRHGLDGARAIALGAGTVSMALPVLRAYHEGGCNGVRRYLTRFIHQLQAALLLTGSRDLAALRAHPAVLIGRLRDWIHARRLES